MKVIQSRLFEKRTKKLNGDQKLQLDDAIREVLQKPEIGEKKKGDLRSVSVYKFHIDGKLFLMAYSCDSEVLELIMLGPHENYYKNLKKYLKTR
jgi:mRNA-degrading endonuclease RelE of RelBE toxin-antitoxin system